MIKEIYDYQDWVNICDKNKWWRSQTSPFKAYNNSGKLVAEWDKYKGYGKIYESR